MTPHALATQVSGLFALPDLAVRACAVLDAPTATAQDLVEVIELDAGLAATLLRLANSALYGQTRRVETLTRAVALIGNKAVRDLVVATAAVKTFRDIPEEFVDMDSFWDNSITAGVLAKLLARYARLPDTEALFLVGLLHGVGRLVFYRQCPAQYREVLARAQAMTEPAPEGHADPHAAHRMACTLWAAEEQVFGFTYAEVGGALLQAWQLPERLHAAVSMQHHPESAGLWIKEACVAHLAAQLGANLAPCLKTEEDPPPYQPDEVAAHAMQTLGVTPAHLAEIRMEALAASLEVIEIIHPGATIVF